MKTQAASGRRRKGAEGYTRDMDPREDETHVAAGTDIWTALAATSEDE